MNAPIGEGMNGVEVEKRLSQPVSFSYMLSYQTFHVVVVSNEGIFHFYTNLKQDDKHVIDMANNPTTSQTDVRADASQLPPLNLNVTGPKSSRTLLPSQSMVSYIFTFLIFSFKLRNQLPFWHFVTLYF